jgi:hypothetical protein
MIIDLKKAGYLGNINNPFIDSIIFQLLILVLVKNNGIQLKQACYFLGDINTTTPPTPITAIPIRGDQLR